MQLASEKIILKTGSTVEITGMYSYAGNPDPHEIACWPSTKERTVFLKHGDKVPPITTCKGHSALYELIGRS